MFFKREHVAPAARQQSQQRKYGHMSQGRSHRHAHTDTGEYISRSASGAVLMPRFFSGGAESVGETDSKWNFSDRWKKAARGLRADSRTGCMELVTAPAG